MNKAGARWVCTGRDQNGEPCPVKATTRWAHSPRAHPYLPHNGQSRNYVPLRRVLLRRRNASESTNARLKGRGIGNDGMNTPRWVRTDNEFKWLTYSTLLAFTLQRLAHATGLYEPRTRKPKTAVTSTPAQPSPAPPVIPAGRVSTSETLSQSPGNNKPFDFLETLVA